MLKTDFSIATNGSPIRAVDADGNGHFIALTESGRIFAHDFETDLNFAQNNPPLKFRFPIIRRLDAKRFLIADSWTQKPCNSRIFDLEGKERDAFHIGEAIHDILIFNEKIVIMYREEGIPERKYPNASGLAVFSLDGRQLWGFNDLVDQGELPEEALILDSMPLCKNGSDSLLFFSHYFSSNLTELNLDDFKMKFTPVPQRVQVSDAISPINGSKTLFHLPGSQFPEPDHEKFFWWDHKSEDVEELPEKFPGPVKGIGNGRFLAASEFNYTIIDPLALSIKETRQIGSRRLELVLDDITNMEIDAIVNAANSQLAGGFGVDGSIHRLGGPKIMEETREKFPNGCPTGSAVASNAGTLNAKYVLHAVGPRWFEEPERFDLLRSAYQRCLELAVERNCRSIAFPSISTGDFGYPVHESAKHAIECVYEFLKTLPPDAPLELVRFCLFSEKDLQAYRAALL